MFNARMFLKDLANSSDLRWFFGFLPLAEYHRVADLIEYNPRIIYERTIQNYSSTDRATRGNYN